MTKRRVNSERMHGDLSEIDKQKRLKAQKNAKKLDKTLTYFGVILAIAIIAFTIWIYTAEWSESKVFTQNRSIKITTEKATSGNN